MDLKLIANVYAENARTRQRFIALLETVSPDEAEAKPGGKWSIKEIVEHVALVDEGTSRICRKLVDKAIAAGRPSDGELIVSTRFGERSAQIATMKVEAPERVQPTGGVSFEESLERLEASRKAFIGMRTEMATHDLSGATFPHPFMGELTAAEWLMVAGGHEMRHIKQIERQLAEIRK
jgi:uncharacterized damage-inducible protein DinB